MDAKTTLQWDRIAGDLTDRRSAGWPVGLARSLREARAFHATIAVAALGGSALNFTSLDPIRALYWSAVFNGIVAAPILAL